jgi:peptidoglycan/xylan/chitin deacetylase (PgdA/CDA1 family)
MKLIIKLFTPLLVLSLLCACGADAAAPTGTAAPEHGSVESNPDTTPADTTSPYPTPDKIIALTFDDCPNKHMGTILDVLAEYDAKASFYVIGRRIEGENSNIILRAFQEGHEIGSHSYNHEDMTIKTEAEILNEIKMTQTAVKEVTGVEPVWYRPPFLRSNDLTYSLIEMPHASCAVSAGDGSNDNLPEDRHYRVTTGAYDGAIVLLHCNDITAEVLPQILHDLKMQGYEFVTTSELFARVNKEFPATPGSMYKDNK